MRILAIGVHPDDIEFGMGAVLSKHISIGDKVSIIVLTDGKRNDNGDYIRSDERRQESKKALKILGYTHKIKFLNLCKVKINQPTIKIIEEEINKFKPDRIYTHTKNDRHQDHRNCYYIVLSAGRYVNEILLFEIYSTFPDFLPSYIINISRDLLDLKIKAIKCFKSQFKNIELISKMIEGSAIKNSFPTYTLQTKEIYYSETFEILKIVKKLNDV